MRDTEFKAAALALLTEIRDGVVRVADACERAERWTAHPDVTPANAAAMLLEPDPLTASTEAECGPLGGVIQTTIAPPGAGKRKRGRRG